MARVALFSLGITSVDEALAPFTGRYALILQRGSAGPGATVVTIQSSHGVRRTVPVHREVIGVVSKAATDTVNQVLQSQTSQLESESVTGTDGVCLLLELDLHAGDLIQSGTLNIKEFHYLGERDTVIQRRVVSYQ